MLKLSDFTIHSEECGISYVYIFMHYAVTTPGKKCFVYTLKLHFSSFCIHY